MKRCPGVTITPHTEPVQTFPKSFFEQFQIIIGGLDNVEARRWINAMIHDMVPFVDGKPGDVGTYFIDGGTEGFQGQARVIVPFQTGCYECSLDTLTKETGYPLCTVRETPRLPEHCIQFAMVISWPEHFEKPLDKDSPDDMKWIFNKAQERAESYKIEGVTYELTMGVVKNIIPAVASTNALVSAACVNEAVKILSGCNNRLDNYMLYLGQTRLSISAFPY